MAAPETSEPKKPEAPVAEGEEQQAATGQSQENTEDPGVSVDAYYEDASGSAPEAVSQAPGDASGEAAAANGNEYDSEGQPANESAEDAYTERPPEGAGAAADGNAAVDSSDAPAAPASESSSSSANVSAAEVAKYRAYQLAQQLAAKAGQSSEAQEGGPAVGAKRPREGADESEDASAAKAARLESGASQPTAAAPAPAHDPLAAGRAAAQAAAAGLGLAPPPSASGAASGGMGYGAASSSSSSAAGAGSDAMEVMTVPNTLIGSVIGRGGENIRALQARTQCTIKVDQDSRDPMAAPDRPRTVTIYGPAAGVAAAKAEIDGLVSQKMQMMAQGGEAGGAGAGRVTAGPSVRCKIPDNKTGLVIGRGGRTIRGIQDRTGAHLDVPRAPDADDPTSRTVVITAPTEAAAKAAQEEVFGLLAADEARQSGGAPGADVPGQTVPVPNDTVGALIGRGGSVVQDMQARSGASIQIPRDPTGAERMVRVTGAPAAVAMAVQMIQQKVQEAQMGIRSGPPGGGYGGGGGVAGAGAGAYGAGAYGGQGAGGYGGMQQGGYGQAAGMPAGGAMGAGAYGGGMGGGYAAPQAQGYYQQQPQAQGYYQQQPQQGGAQQQGYQYPPQ